MEEQEKDVTTEETQEVESSTTEASETVEPSQEEKHVPYERFKEINDRYRETEQKLEKLQQDFEASRKPQEPENPQAQVIKDQLKQLGFMSREDFVAEQQRQKEDAAVEAEISRLESEWDGREGKPKFNRQEVIKFAVENGINDLEAAFLKVRKAEVINYHIAQASNKTKGVKSEASDGSGAIQGTSKDDLKSAAMSGDKGALKGYLKTFMK